MDTTRYETKLREKLVEINDEMARLRDEARSSGDVEVRDSIDQADDAQQSGDVGEKAGIWTSDEEQVRDALERVKKGTYGKCIECGKSIGTARLDAVPWAAYCVADQARAENPLLGLAR